MSSASPIRPSGVLLVICVHHRLVAHDVVEGAREHAADRDGVDPDRGREVLGSQARVVGERRLRRPVGQVSPAGDAADHAGDVHDRAAVVLQHVRHRRPRQRVGGGDVEVERLLQIVRVGVEQGVGDGPADVVHHDVQAAELVVRRVGERRRPTRASSGSRAPRAHAARPPRPARRPSSSWSSVRGRQQHVGPRLRQRHRRRRPDATTGSRDDRDLPVHPEPVQNHGRKCNRF